MRKITYSLVAILLFTLATVSPSFAFGGGGAPTTEPQEPVITGEMTALTIPVRPQGGGEIMEVPLFSEEYARLPVAMVNEEPITLQEFAVELATMHNEMGEGQSPTGQSFTSLLDRLIAIKLVKQEALNIGFDRTPEVQNQIKNFALKTMIQQLLAQQLTDIQVSKDEVDTLYQEMAIEAKLLTYSFTDKATAEKVRDETQAGGDFKNLADEMVAAGQAEGGEEAEYAPLTELLPAVAKAVYDMEPGSVSEIFKGSKNFLLFWLEDKRVYEDPDVRLQAEKQLLQQESRKVQYAYLESLIDKYVTFDEAGENALDFAKIEEENPGISGTETFSRLSNDMRPLATVNIGEQTIVVSVAEIAEKVKGTLYHGLDRAIDGGELNREKELAIWNQLVAICGRLEAQAQGIDQTPEFKETVQRFADRVLFDTFMAKAVVPGVKVPEEDVKKYYYNHLEDYSTPLMLKMKSLVFNDEQSALDAFKKLQVGSDFKWVSANTAGQADDDNKDILNLDGSLLAANVLPEDLQNKMVGAQKGDLFYYAGPNQLYYTLQIESAFEPKAQTYQEVRQEVGKIIYGQKINEALEEWVGKLKEAYETEVFIVQEKL